MRIRRHTACAILGVLILCGVALAADFLPPQTTMLVVSEEGSAHMMVPDTLTGWPVLLPLPIAAREAFTSVTVGADGQAYLCDPCGGWILGLESPGESPRSFYDASFTPASDCTERVCNPYADWLGPSSVAVSPAGDVFVASLSNFCPYGRSRVEGIVRLDLSSDPPNAYRQIPLPDALTQRLPAVTRPLSIAVPSEGPNAGTLLIVATFRDSVEVYATALDDSTPSIEPTLPSGFDPADSATVFLTQDGGFVSVDAHGTVTWFRHSLPPVPLTRLVEASITATNVDPHGNLYVAVRSARSSRLLRFDASGTLSGVITLYVHPVSLAVLSEMSAQ